MLAREEVNPELEGTLNLIDSETNGNMRVTMGSTLEKEYKSNYNRFIKNIDTLARRYHAKYLRIVADESLDNVLYNIN